MVTGVVHVVALAASLTGVLPLTCWTSVIAAYASAGSLVGIAEKRADGTCQGTSLHACKGPGRPKTTLDGALLNGWGGRATPSCVPDAWRGDETKTGGEGLSHPARHAI